MQTISIVDCRMGSEKRRWKSENVAGFAPPTPDGVTNLCSGTGLLQFSFLLPQDVVPTAMDYHHGKFYVGNLTTFPLVQGAAHIYQISPSGRVRVVVSGLTNVVGVAFSKRGQLYVLESTVGHPLPTPNAGAVVRVLRDGRMLQAGSLRPGQSLMPLYREHVRGYEMVYQPINGHLDPTRRLADEWNVRNGIYADEPGTHRHHIDFDRRKKRSVRGGARLLDCDRSVFRRFPGLVERFRGHAPVRNHKVVAIRELPGDHDVYCLTVPEAGNFALEAGVFVRNCGIIVNVTPLEPEWEGHVTLEFSNTTPLPAKIYANEGVAQVIFFESDEVCETSYKDRGGKYQGQQGVTLPKI